MTETEKYFKEHGHYPFKEVEKWVSESITNCISKTIIDSTNYTDENIEVIIYLLMYAPNKFMVQQMTKKDSKLIWCYSFVDFRFATEFYFEYSRMRTLYHKHIGG